MNLYSLEENGLIEVSTIPFANEKEIQTTVENNLHTIFELEFIATEFPVSNYRLDTLAYDKENNSFVIIEYKNTHSYSVVDQGYTYLSLLLDRKADFILQYSTKTGKQVGLNDIDWSLSRVIFVAPTFNTYQLGSVNFSDIPFELWEIKKYQNKTIALEQKKPQSRQRIETYRDLDVVGQLDGEPFVVIDETYHLSNVSASVVQLWENLRDRYIELGDTDLNYKKHYISIRKNGFRTRAICFVHFYVDYLQITISEGYIKSDGVRSGNFIELIDPENIGERRISNNRDGSANYEYYIRVSNNRSLELAISIINQRYQAY
jgi:hypothetical protein